MTALETAVYQQVPTDEAEAQMLASADLDDMKSKGGVTEECRKSLLFTSATVGHISGGPQIYIYHLLHNFLS